MKLSTFRPLVTATLALALVAGLAAQAPVAPKLEFPAASPTATLKQRVGVTDIEIVYSRPSLKGRVAFGGLEPYGAVWRTGANNATRITFSTEVKVQGSALAAGTYELFSIPGKTDWTVIFQKAGKQWGAYAYKPENDTLRVPTKSVVLAAPVETLTIDLNDVRDSSATLNLSWEKTRVPVKIDVDIVAALVPQIEAAMAVPGDKKPHAQAAMFYLDNNLDLKKAAAWMDAAIAAQPDAFYLVFRKGLILEKLGDKAGALAVAKASLAGAEKAPSPLLKEEYVRRNNELIARLK
ncbi:MAG: DUF2911 domain-containing protein [Opitutaceae bacterium]